jgi:hypothetical protein
LTRPATLSAAATLAVLAGAWFGWERLGAVTATLGLGWLDPLPRLVLAAGALTLLDAALSRLASPSDHP